MEWIKPVVSERYSFEKRDFSKTKTFFFAFLVYQDLVDRNKIRVVSTFLFKLKAFAGHLNKKVNPVFLEKIEFHNPGSSILIALVCITSVWGSQTCFQSKFVLFWAQRNFESEDDRSRKAEEIHLFAFISLLLKKI